MPTTDIRSQVIGTVQRQELKIDTRGLDSEARTVELAWSSEQGVERWWGVEILDHAPSSVRLGRLTDSAPLLLQHDPNRQIGVIESARIDSDKRGRAGVRFSRSSLGEEIMQDVADGIRTKVSVGYMIHDMKLDRSGDDGDVYRITDWEPIEVSIVSIPADNSVGVGRAHNPTEVTAMPKASVDNPVEREDEIDSTNLDPQPVREERAAEPTPAVVAPVNPEADQIRAVGSHFGMRDLAEDHIMLGGTLQQFRDKIRTMRPDPVPSAPRVEARIPHAGNLRAFRPEQYAGGRREMEEHAYRAGQWAKATIFGDAQAARWCRDNGVQIAQRVLTGMGAGQSVIVPDELALPIISLREQYGLARRMCYVHPMVTDTASVPRDAGDVTAYFVGREAGPSSSEPVFDNVTLTAKNVAAETKISNDYADDSVINLADYVAEKHARAFAIKEDQCLINGDGTSAYGGIVGLRTLLAAAGGLAGAVNAASNNDTFAEITSTDLRNVMAALQDLPGINPSWVVSKAGQNTLFGRLTDAAGGNTKRDLGASMPEQYGGYPIVTSPVMPTSTGDLSGVVMAIFGDLRLGVIFGDRRGMTMMVDPYSLSSYQQTKIISSERFDINCHGVGTASAAGPIVALVGE
jgi:HK97 family phage major capsid protein/HK97 family phage prohead protease